MICPIIEYVCPVWHAGLNKSETNNIEKIQNRAMNIIYSDIPYAASIQNTQIDFLKTRRERLSSCSFCKVVNPTIDYSTC